MKPDELTKGYYFIRIHADERLRKAYPYSDFFAPTIQIGRLHFNKFCRPYWLLAHMLLDMWTDEASVEVIGKVEMPDGEL